MFNNTCLPNKNVFPDAFTIKRCNPLSNISFPHYDIFKILKKNQNSSKDHRLNIIIRGMLQVRRNSICNIQILQKKQRNLKGALSGLRQFLATESPFTMMKNAFYFTSKAFFQLKIFKFCLDFLVM